MTDSTSSLLPREQRFAEGVARGLHHLSAWRAAGFARDDERALRRLGDPLILAHTERTVAKYAGPIDFHAIVAKLLAIADAGFAQGTDAGARVGSQAAILAMRTLRNLPRDAHAAGDDEAD